MNRILAIVVIVLSLTQSQAAPQVKNDRLVLLNPKLLRCKSSDCGQLWLEDVAEAKAVFPKQLIIDVNQGCLYGVQVLYDKSVPLEDVRAAIDKHYRKWAWPLNDKNDVPVRLWRVEPDKFAIHLSQNDKNDEKRTTIEAGTKDVIYIGFGGASACK